MTCPNRDSNPGHLNQRRLTETALAVALAAQLSQFQPSVLRQQEGGFRRMALKGKERMRGMPTALSIHFEANHVTPDTPRMLDSFLCMFSFQLNKETYCKCNQER
ncbi:uncharacterized protein LOC144183321 isoform X2 [Stigmatopora nigra]